MISPFEFILPAKIKHGTGIVKVLGGELNGIIRLFPLFKTVIYLLITLFKYISYIIKHVPYWEFIRTTAFTYTAFYTIIGLLIKTFIS